MVNVTMTKLKSFGLGVLLDTKAERMVGSQVLQIPLSILVSIGTHQIEINIGKPNVTFDYASLGMGDIERG